MTGRPTPEEIVAKCWKGGLHIGEYDAKELAHAIQDERVEANRQIAKARTEEREAILEKLRPLRIFRNMWTMKEIIEIIKRMK